MSIVLDLIVVSIILLFAFISAKQGFVKVIVEVVGLIAAIILTFTISTPLANTTYDKMIEPSLLKTAAENSSQITDENKILDALPDFITNNSEKLGISLSEFTDSISSNSTYGAQAAIKTASQNIIRPVAVKLIGLIFSVILMVILFFVVKFLAKLINKLFSFSFIGKANRTLGGIIGVFKGIIFAVFFCAVVSLIVSLTKNGFWIFTPESIENSYIFNYIVKIIPFNIF